MDVMRLRCEFTATGRPWVTDLVFDFEDFELRQVDDGVVFDVVEPVDDAAEGDAARVAVHVAVEARADDEAGRRQRHRSLQFQDREVKVALPFVFFVRVWTHRNDRNVPTLVSTVFHFH